jgi:nitroimidazol reductase NimA-like FMN-containing flavoprotein (pyridoxamine 5'-phosphate oxidase superfamily)
MSLVRFSQAEGRFLKRNELGRLATVCPDGTPHVAPVCYIYRAGRFLAATDYETKKYHNLLKNNNVTFVVDVYKLGRGIRGVLIQGTSTILESGVDFRETYTPFYKKFSWVQADPWKEGEASFIRIEPTHSRPGNRKSDRYPVERAGRTISPHSRVGASQQSLTSSLKAVASFFPEENFQLL